MEKAKLEALKSLIVISSFPGNNYFDLILTLTIFILAKFNIHSNEIVCTTNGLIGFRLVRPFRSSLIYSTMNKCFV